MPEPTEAQASTIPEDFDEYLAWRDGGETPAPAAEESAASGAAAEEPKAESVEASEAANESTEQTDETEGEDDDTDEPGKKSGRGVQKKIGKLTRKIHELEEQIAAKSAPAADEQKTEVVEPPVAATPADGKPLVADFENYEDFIEALTDWKADQRELAKTAKTEQDARDEAARTAEAAYQEQLSAARERYDDYDEVVGSEDIKISEAMQAAMLTSELGAELAYHFGKNPEDAERLMQLPPIAQVREMGKLEAKLAAEATAAEEPAAKPAKAAVSAPAPKAAVPVPQPKKVSSAPKPPSHVSGKAPSTPSVYDPATAEDFEEWSKVREAQLRR